MTEKIVRVFRFTEFCRKMAEAQVLRNLAIQILGDIAINLDNVFIFTNAALHADQLDRVIAVMEACQVRANHVVNPHPPPPPVVEVFDDNMDDDDVSGITDGN